MIGLALGGGGSRGFAHLGVVKALRELGIPVGCIAGTSIGAIVGGIIASDGFQKAIDWADEPDWMKLPLLFSRLHKPWRGMIGTRRIEALFAEMIPVPDFAALHLPFAAVATDLFTGEAVVMDSGDVKSAIRASMAIPGFFEPIERDGRVLVDGGIANAVPVDVCRRMGATKVIAVDINARTAGDARIPYAKLNVVDIIDLTFTVICNRAAKGVFADAKPDCLLEPPVGDVKMLDFRGGQRLIDIGYETAMARKDEILQLLH